MLSLGSYLLGPAELAVVALSLGLSAFRLRRRFLPAWDGAPARLVEAIVAVALLPWISEVLGTFTLFYAGALVAACVLLATLVLPLTRRDADSAGATGDPSAGGVVVGDPRGAQRRGEAAPEHRGGVHHDRTRGQWAMSLVTLGVVALVFGHWALTTKHALDRGIFNFDSLWYHLPFAADMAQSHSVTGMHYVGAV